MIYKNIMQKEFLSIEQLLFLFDQFNYQNYDKTNHFGNCLEG